MTAEQTRRVLRVFQEAMDVDENRRDELLNRECGGDPGLRARVEEMLAASDEDDDFLEQALLLDLPSLIDEDHLVGTRLGQYELTRVISAGGMGTVYEAVQETPRRIVAVKILREGIASASALRRFQYETEILGRLSHSGIAQIFEAGTHGGEGGTAGVPYFVMEYVADARVITDYASEEDLSVDDRLRLFLQVCDAVQYGHQKGIIHRDLKPGNILVDPQGRVKVIDFGIARSTDADIAMTTVSTRVGELVGTIQYMSPEQCAADPHDLDLRSDVYALGVILYELLCERLPYDLRGLPIFEAARHIRDDRPPRPSTTNRALGRDVEIIVLKALDKDRERRYQTTGDLQADIERFLHRQPILARPPTLRYRFRTFTARNKALVGGLAGTFLALLVGIIVSSALYLRAESARALATEEAEVAQGMNAFYARMLSSLDPSQLHIATPLDPAEMATLMQRETHSLETSVAEMLRMAEPEVETAFADKPELEAAVRETIGTAFFGLGAYREAIAQLETALRIRSAVLSEAHVDLLRTKVRLGYFLREAGRYEEAADLLSPIHDVVMEAFGPRSRAALDYSTVLALVTSECDRTKEADELFQRTLDLWRAEFGVEDRHTLWTMLEWAKSFAFRGQIVRCEALAREAYEVAHEALDPDDYITAFSESVLGYVLCLRGELESGEKLLRRALENRVRTIGKLHPRTLLIRFSLGVRALHGPGALEERSQLLTDALDSVRPTLREDHFWINATVGSLSHILAMYDRQGDLEALLRDRLRRCRAGLGEDHETTMGARAMLGLFLANTERMDEARGLYRDYVESCRQRLGADHAQTLAALRGSVALLALHGPPEEAIEPLSAWVSTAGASLGDDHELTLLALGDLASLLVEAGWLEDARAVARRILEARVRRKERSDATVPDYVALARFLTECDVESLRDPERALAMARKAVELGGDADWTSLETLAWIQHLGNRHEEAAATQRKALACFAKTGPQSREDVENNLIRILLRGDNVTDATALLQDREDRKRARFGNDHHQRGNALVQDAELLAEEGRFAMAESRARRAFEHLRLRSPRDPLPIRAAASAVLGHCLARQGRFEEAEPFLVGEGYDVLEGYLLVEPQRLGKVRTWVVDLYERWGRPADAERYRKQ